MAAALYYVLVFGSGPPEILSTWRETKIKLKGSPRSWCKSFPSKVAAREFVTTLTTHRSFQTPDDGIDVHVHASSTRMTAVFDGGRTIVEPVLEGTSLPRAHLLATLMALKNSPENIPLVIRSSSETVHRIFSVGLPEGFANGDVITALRTFIHSRRTGGGASVLVAPPRKNAHEAITAVAESRSYIPPDI
jgi:hypothetical protein